MTAALARPFGAVLLMLAAAMAPSILLALSQGGEGLEPFLLAFTVTGLVGGGLWLSAPSQPAVPPPGVGLPFLALVWFAVPVFAALPMLEAAGSLLDAYVEAISAFTTTGATVFPHVSELSRPVVLWRAMLQGAGGLATIVFAATVLASAGAGGPAGVAKPGAIGLSVRLWTALSAAAPLYAGLMALCVAALMMAKTPFFEALCLALATLSAGGMEPRDGLLASAGAPVLAVLVPFMLAGAASAPWLAALTGKRAHARREALALVAIVAALGLGLAAAVRLEQPTLAGPGALAGSLFAVASLVSTTGFTPAPEVAHAAPPLLVLILVLAGGGAVSAAGGLKLFRIGLLLQAVREECVRLVYRNVVLAVPQGGLQADPVRRAGVAAVFSLGVLLWLAATAVLALRHPSFEGAVSLAAAMLANAGPVYGPGWLWGPGWPAFSELDGFDKLACAVAMVAGRLDFLAFVALFDPSRWRR
ncbi:potassium transporter TrkG [Alsobacter sp. KACC 23698]|uniref:Potassium transporter TrkG n=1 Tax=Alsobacter sp. KACC 23698 TaxID=3149229 RepID=A0AAU7JM03_9HYPH